MTIRNTKITILPGRPNGTVDYPYHSEIETTLKPQLEIDDDGLHWLDYHQKLFSDQGERTIVIRVIDRLKRIGIKNVGDYVTHKFNSTLVFIFSKIDLWEGR